MGLTRRETIDTLGDCEVCSRPLSAYGGHAACVIERLGGEVASLRRQLQGAVSLDTAVGALADVLVDYDVPTGRIVDEFKRLAAEYEG